MHWNLAMRFNGLPILFAPVLLTLTSASEGTTDATSVRNPSSPPDQLHWGDFDGDGLDDALAITPTGGLELLRNLGDGAFEDATESAGLNVVRQARFVLWQDYDGDSTLDLFVGTAQGPSYLLQNQSGNFVDRAFDSGIVATGFDIGAHWIDYDRDGLLDLHLANEQENTLYHALASGLFEPVSLGPVAQGRASFVGPLTVREAGNASAGQVPGDAGLPSGGSSPVIAGTIRRDSVPASAGSSASLLACVLSLSDANGGGCLEASSTPTLGMLYPLSNDFFVDETTGNVGIGTLNPERGFHVHRDGESYPIQVTGNQNPGIRIRNSGASSSWVIFHRDDDYLTFRDNTSAKTRMVISGGDGNVGIGTTTPTKTLDVAGDAIVDVLTIRGGADLVEGFDTLDGELEPGTVVVIDPANAGALMRSSEPYDFKVAGVVSGAGGVDPGLHLGQDGVLDGDTKVAMTGRVYAWCSDENGSIRPGDRLTTARLEGHAMKATDVARADGAVIGKAMSHLDEGTGLVLVLVNLQ